MKFLHEGDREKELALEDVFLVQRLSEVSSRRQVALGPVDFKGATTPLVVANMTAACGRRMAEVTARYGGLAILPQDGASVDVAAVIRRVKFASARFDSAVTVSPDDELHTVQRLINKREALMVVVLASDGQVVGVFSESDLKRGMPSDKVSDHMTRGFIHGASSMSSKDLFMVLENNRLHAVPVLDENGVLAGTVTRNLLVHQTIWGPALDNNGGLQVGAAIGLNGNIEERVRTLLEAGVDALVIDTAHGGQSSVGDSIKRARVVLTAMGSQAPIIAGNVCTAETTKFLIEAGADIVKVNVGPGAMCTTRMQTGVGRPSFSAVVDCAAAARECGKHVWADGGVKNPRDVALYMAAGASRVMFGTAFAGTYESPAEVQFDQDGQPFKSNHGMASFTAVKARSQGDSPFEAYTKGLYEEGIRDSRVYIRKGQATVGELFLNYITGLQSTCTYSGVGCVADLHENAIIGVQTSAGYHEGTPHGAVRK